MLFKQHHLREIQNGNVTLAFRRWKRPSVRQGSIIRTSVGQIEIVATEEIHAQEITSQDARKAGFHSLEELLTVLESAEHGNIFRIKVAFHSPDPRIALRNQTDMTPEKYKEVKAKLERLDKYSKEGHWTHMTLMTIQENPNVRAADLATLLSKEKNWLKINIRKLKNLGLTISKDPGYEISPLGNAYLRKTINESE